MMEVITVTDQHRQVANEMIASLWSSTKMVVRGELIDTAFLDGFAIIEDNHLLGHITYRITGKECEITSLFSVRENQGVGTALILKVKEEAIRNNCNALKLITTNDNINGIRFYQKRGFDMIKLYHNAMEQTRKLKPEVPLIGEHDIPLRHEIEFEMVLSSSKDAIPMNDSGLNAFGSKELQTQGSQTKVLQAKDTQTKDAQTKESLSDILIYTDGSARGNPDGPGGYGTILTFTDSKGNTIEREYSAGYKKTTNNRMELMAAIVGLEALKKPCRVTLYSDSQYLVKAFNDHWLENWIKKGWKTSQKEPVKNIDLWKRLLKATQPHNVTFEWVRGHNGHPMNERCDTLATAAADGNNLADDVITE